MTALIFGTMRGTVNGDGTACFRIAEEAPSIPMFWPFGYYAMTDPLRVIDANGKTVAVDGQHVRLGGGTADLGKKTAIVGCGEATQVLLIG